MKYLVENKHWEINKEYSKEKLLYFLIDRPDKINIFDDFFWYNDKNQYHRNYDLPTTVGKNGYLSWQKSNKIHREDDKPAIIYKNGKKYWTNRKHTK